MFSASLYSTLTRPRHGPDLSPCCHVTCQIYHPNVDLEGNVCLNILREDWKPVLNLNSVMVGLQYLFLEPNADDPLNKGKLPVENVTHVDSSADHL